MKFPGEAATALDEGIKILEGLRSDLLKVQKKRGRRPSARDLADHRRIKTLMRSQVRKLQDPAGELLAELKRRVTSALRRKKGGFRNGSEKTIIDWKSYDAWAVKFWQKYILESLGIGGEAIVSGRILRKDSFDLLNEEAINWAKIHATALITLLNKEARNAILEVILAAIKAGLSTQQIGRQIRKFIGLNASQAGAVIKFRAALIADGVPAAEIERLVARKVAKGIRYRAFMIARTETAYSMNEGIRQGYSQVGVKKLMRVEDPVGTDGETCDCREKNGTIYTIEEAEGVLPEHPNCEGAWAAAE